jgi:choline dehydrogenase-like flavoprotein
MTSGVGPADALARHGIEVVRDLPGVGGNLRDHPSITLPVQTPPDFEEDGRNHVMLVYTTEGSPKYNDMQIILCAVRTVDASGATIRPLTVVAMQQASEARGSISLTSADPLVPPRIVFNYLETELDRSRLRDATRLMSRLVDHVAFASIGVKRTGPGDDVLASDPLLDEWVAANIFTLFHSCGTCRMGDAGDRGAVVDERGGVHGLQGLRIADLSIAPDVPRTPTNATAFMLGERIADLVKEDST